MVSLQLQRIRHVSNVVLNKGVVYSVPYLVAVIRARGLKTRHIESLGLETRSVKFDASQVAYSKPFDGPCPFADADNGVLAMELESNLVSHQRIQGKRQKMLDITARRLLARAVPTSRIHGPQTS